MEVFTNQKKRKRNKYIYEKKKTKNEYPNKYPSKEKHSLFGNA